MKYFLYDICKFVYFLTRLMIIDNTTTERTTVFASRFVTALFFMINILTYVEEMHLMCKNMSNYFYLL